MISGGLSSLAIHALGALLTIKGTVPQVSLLYLYGLWYSADNLGHCLTGDQHTCCFGLQANLLYIPLPRFKGIVSRGKIIHIVETSATRGTTALVYY